MDTDGAVPVGRVRSEQINRLASGLDLWVESDRLRSAHHRGIVDPDVDKNPVDGGVFDIAGSGVRTIPIDAKLLVDGPTTFVVTKERAGGVVVSLQEDVRAVAKFTE